MKKQNKSKDDRREQILKSAFDMAILDGYDSLTRDAVADRAGVASGQINWIFGEVDNLRGEVLSRAIEKLSPENIKRETFPAELMYVVAKGLAAGHSVAKGAPENIKLEALKLLC